MSRIATTLRLHELYVRMYFRMHTRYLLRFLRNPVLLELRLVLFFGTGTLEKKEEGENKKLTQIVTGHYDLFHVCYDAYTVYISPHILYAVFVASLITCRIICLR